MRAAALILLVAVAGCGDDGTSAQDLSIGDLAVPADLPPVDLACVPATDGSVACAGALMCGAGTLCCVSAGGTASCEGCCASGSLAVQCRGSQDCSGNPCCMTLKSNKPTSMLCTDTMSQCPSSLTLGGLGGISGATRLCQTSADCTRGATDTQFPDCCTGTFNGQTTHFCFTTTRTVGGITCP